MDLHGTNQLQEYWGASLDRRLLWVLELLIRFPRWLLTNCKASKNNTGNKMKCHQTIRRMKWERSCLFYDARTEVPPTLCL